MKGYLVFLTCCFFFSTPVARGLFHFQRLVSAECARHHVLKHAPKNGVDGTAARTCSRVFRRFMNQIFSVFLTFGVRPESRLGREYDFFINCNVKGCVFSSVVERCRLARHFIFPSTVITFATHLFCDYCARSF